MALTDKEKEYYLTSCANRLKPIQKKYWKENKELDYNFTLNRIQRVAFAKERFRTFIEESLDIYVQSFIEVHKKLKKKVDEIDYDNLVENLKILVNSGLKSFSGLYRKNPLSSVGEDSVIESKIYILSQELPSLIPDSLLSLSEFMCEMELLVNVTTTDEYERALEIIKNTMLSQSRNRIEFAQHDEDSYRKLIAHSLNGNYKGQVVLESLNQNGKTDILLRINNKNVLIAECKIWKGEQSFKDAINQLLDRYLEWHDDKAVLIIFTRNSSLTKVLSIMKQAIEGHNKYNQTLESADEDEFRFYFHHPEDNNRKLFLSVLAFKIPKNQSPTKINALVETNN